MQVIPEREDRHIERGIGQCCVAKRPVRRDKLQIAVARRTRRRKRLAIECYRERQRYRRYAVVAVASRVHSARNQSAGTRRHRVVADAWRRSCRRGRGRAYSACDRTVYAVREIAAVSDRRIGGQYIVETAELRASEELVAVVPRRRPDGIKTRRCRIERISRS